MDVLHQLTRPSVLCIGNDVESGAFIRETLSQLDVVVAPNAFEAIRGVHARAFDAYVTDFWLPDWSGPPLCRAIRKIDPNCPILFWTNADRPNARGRALRAGASAYLCKPSDAGKVRPTLVGLLATADARSAAAKASLERAVAAEIERCRSHVGARAQALEGKDGFVERAARTRGYKAFIDAGGSRAHFERWWPHVFGRARGRPGT